MQTILARYASYVHWAYVGFQTQKLAWAPSRFFKVSTGEALDHAGPVSRSVGSLYERGHG